MSLLKNTKIKAKLMLLAGTAVCGLMVFGVVALNTISTVKITSSLYERIVIGRDAVADYSPPSENVVASITYAVKAEEAPDQATQEKFINKIHDARTKFEDRHKYYASHFPEGKLKDLILGDAYRLGQNWFQVAEQEFIPAVRDDRKKAHDVRVGKMAPLFAQQQVAVAAIQAASADWLKAEEQEASSTVSSRNTILLIFGVASLAVVSVLGFVIARGILGP